jgi:hypothetical protein
VGLGKVTQMPSIRQRMHAGGGKGSAPKGEGCFLRLDERFLRVVGLVKGMNEQGRHAGGAKHGG